MRNRMICVLLAVLWGGLLVIGTELPFTRQQTKNIMRRVADWQIASLVKQQDYPDLNWTNAALYRGMVDWAKLCENTDSYEGYWKWLKKIGKRNHYQMNKSMYHADDIAVGQTFIELYLKYGDPRMLWPVQARTDWVVAHPAKGTMKLDYSKIETTDRWTWCDALFMAPPVYARMYRLTGDKKYLDFMNSEFQATYDYLYDKEEHLFYRDGRYFTEKESNGKKVFWGRGNGWVMGALADLLNVLRKGDVNYSFYKSLFLEMSEKVKDLQGTDGFWHASLLNPVAYPSPEASASAFFVYALAYGVKNGILDEKVYLPVVEKGWKALLSVVTDEGKLCYVQPVGADPKKVTRDMTEVYGVGAFLMAGCQIYELCKK